MRYTCEKRGYGHPVLLVVVAPILRLQDSSVGMRVVGFMGGVISWFANDAFFVIAFLLVASGTADTIYGRSIAKALDTFDEQRATIGLHSKIMGIVLAGLIRGFEAWWEVMTAGGRFEGWHTAGFLSAAVALTLFVNDLKSIQEKRIRYGQPPLPVLGKALDLIDGLAALLGGPPPGGQIERRDSDPPTSTSHLKRGPDDRSPH